MNSRLMAPPLSKNNIEIYAHCVRKHFGIQKCMYLPIMTIVECILPKFDPEFNFVTLYESEMFGEYARYCPQTNTLSVRQDVYLDACNNDPRHRFTIAHELGHYFLHNEISAFSRCSEGDIIPSYRDPEWQANTFAASLLMPKDLIMGMTPEQVALKCGTSLQAAKIALKSIH